MSKGTKRFYRRSAAGTRQAAKADPSTAKRSNTTPTGPGGARFEFPPPNPPGPQLAEDLEQEAEDVESMVPPEQFKQSTDNADAANLFHNYGGGPLASSSSAPGIFMSDSEIPVPDVPESPPPSEEGDESGSSPASEDEPSEDDVSDDDAKKNEDDEVIENINKFYPEKSSEDLDDKGHPTPTTCRRKCSKTCSKVFRILKLALLKVYHLIREIFFHLRDQVTYKRLLPCLEEPGEDASEDAEPEVPKDNEPSGSAKKKQQPLELSAYERMPKVMVVRSKYRYVHNIPFIVWTTVFFLATLYFIFRGEWHPLCTMPVDKYNPGLVLYNWFQHHDKSIWYVCRHGYFQFHQPWKRLLVLIPYFIALALVRLLFRLRLPYCVTTWTKISPVKMSKQRDLRASHARSTDIAIREMEVCKYKVVTEYFPSPLYKLLHFGRATKRTTYNLVSPVVYFSNVNRWNSDRTTVLRKLQSRVSEYATVTADMWHYNDIVQGTLRMCEDAHLKYANAFEHYDLEELRTPDFLAGSRAL